MSRSRTRARNRRAQRERVRAEFQQKRQDPEALADLVRRLAESDLRVWDIARPAAGDKPLDDAECAMIAQIVAPPLAGMTPVRSTFATKSPAWMQELRGTSQVSSLTPEI